MSWQSPVSALVVDSLPGKIILTLTWSGVCCPALCRAMMAVRRGYPRPVMTLSSSLSSGLRADRSSTDESRAELRLPHGEALRWALQQFGLRRIWKMQQTAVSYEIMALTTHIFQNPDCRSERHTAVEGDKSHTVILIKVVTCLLLGFTKSIFTPWKHFKVAKKNKNRCWELI